jgi:cyclic pyranopterin phosphate synthase
MSFEPLSYNQILAIAELWRDIGAPRELEIGALEPLLWRSGRYRIDHVVDALVQRGFKVSITTNGQLLDEFAVKLRQAGLTLIRTSWHSTDPLMFREISGGYGDYGRFLRGITLALDLGIKVSFNRVLLKGFVDDLPQQISFISEHRSRLKLYTLMWTPQDAPLHALREEWRPMVRALILPRTARIERVKKQIGRSRLRFHLINGGSVEVKLGDRLNRSGHPCASCEFKERCQEGFGDYVRIDPRLHLYFCYMRRDLGFYLGGYFGKPDALKQRMREVLGVTDVDPLLASTSLRLTVTPFCNFNCRIPGALRGWCMEEPGDYVYPKIRESLLTR